MQQNDLEPRDALPAMTAWVKGTMLGIAVGLSLVFGIAFWLNPYDETGAARSMETHRQMGLPPCTFKVMTSWPCPSCGMTTSFALLVRGDLWSSLRANAVGTVLAFICLAYIPWSLVSVFRERPVLIRSMERALLTIVAGFVVLMMLRWGVVIALLWWNGTT